MTPSATPAGSNDFVYSNSFTPAGPRKKRKPKPGQQPLSLATRVHHIKDGLARDTWTSHCQQLLRDSLTSVSFANPDILCLGLGSPSSSADARIQLCFLLLICEHLKIGSDKVSIYDPVFVEDDINFLQGLGFQLLQENREGDYPLQGPTLLFMPHCDLVLYENVLKANWSRERISNVVIVGNAISEYIERNPVRKMEASFPCVLRIAPSIDSLLFPPSSSWPTAFNNTAIQFVRPSAIEDLCDNTGSEENKECGTSEA